MRIFVSGVAGFLGSHLAERYVTMGSEVVGCDNLIGGDTENVPDGVQYEEADCCDVEHMRRLTKDVELVYHCAAIATEGLSVFSPAIIGQHVYQSTAGLLAACISNGAKRFVYCSSMARYGAGKVPFEESQGPEPEDPYGIAKYAGELLTANLCETHGLEYVIAVPHNIIGPRQKYDDPYRNVASIMINRMLQGEQPIIYGDGKQERCFSFVQDCVNPLVKMGCLPDMSGEILNIGPDEESVTILELANKLAVLMDFDLDPIFVPGRPREVRYALCSAEKARRLLAYETTTTLDEGLSSMIDWIRERGPKPFHYHLPIEIDTDLVPSAWRERMF